MSAARDVRLPPYLVRLKMGCADAVGRVNNQKRVAEIGQRSQGRISDFCNPQVPDFMPLDVALRIDAEALALTGVAPIAEAMAEARDVLATGGMNEPAEPMAVHLARFAEKSAELIREMASRHADQLSPAASREILSDVDRVADALRQLVEDMVGGAHG